MKWIDPLRHRVRRPRAGWPDRCAVRAAQDEGKRVTLLAGERGRLIDQPGDIGIQAGARAGCGVAAVVAGLVVLVWGVRGRAWGGPELADRGWAAWVAGRLVIPVPRLFPAAALIPWHA